MKKQFNLKNFLYNFVVLLAIATVFFKPSPLVVVGAAVVAMVTGTLMSLSAVKGFAFMAIQVEIWQNYIEEEIFKDNSFLRFSHSADDNVINSKVVHIPQSAGSGGVQKNRSTLPATVRKRNDTDVIYVLDEYTTDPVHIPHADTKELSYDKIGSVLGEDRDNLVERIADETIWTWLNSGAHGTYAATAFPTGNILTTTGADVANGASATGATGSRKAGSINDLQRMQTYFRQNKRWFEGKMNCLLDPQTLAEMFPADSIVTATYMNNVTEAERRLGIMYKAQGWNIMSRSTVASVTAAGVVNAVGAIGDATDDGANLFWYTQSVEFAFGGVEAFEDLGNPQYYGDIYSFLARTGGRARRAGYEGIALLAQGK